MPPKSKNPRDENPRRSLHQPNDDRLLRRPAVEQLTGQPPSTIYFRMRQGTFPKQVRIGENAVAWREADIKRWMKDPTGWTPE